MSASERARAAIESARDDLLELSRTIHEHPELGYAEFHAAAATADILERSGFAVERGAAGLPTAIRATSGTGSLHVGLCAEYDALPDVGHACGHNIIAAASVGAAIGLAAVADEIDATIVLLGTPSEEGGGGKIDLIEAGCLSDLHLAMMVHPWPADWLDARCLAVDHFDVTFLGVEAHASAAPWEGVNALDAWTISQVAIGLLRQQLRPGDQVHDMILEGGSAANIIPSRIVGRYMCRSVTADRLEELRRRITACFEAGALATGSTFEVTELGHPFSHLEADQDILAHYRWAAESLGRRFDLDDAGQLPPTISTDMGNVSLYVPSIHPLISIETHGAVNHQPAFTSACQGPSANTAVLDGARSLAATAISVSADLGLRQRLLGR